VAIVVGPLVLLLAGLLDAVVMKDLQRRAGADLDLSWLPLATTLGTIVVAASVLLVGVLAWQVRSAPVGAVYLVLGALFVFLPVIDVSLRPQVDLLPAGIGDAIDQAFGWSTAPLNAVWTIGAGMLVGGVAGLVRTPLAWAGARAAGSPAAIVGDRAGWP